MAPQPEWPQIVMDRTSNASTAYCTAAATESSAAPGSNGAGTRLPTLRTVKRSPGPLLVIMLVTRRESAQVRKSWEGVCPSRASLASSGRISGAVCCWNTRTPSSSRPCGSSCCSMQWWPTQGVQARQRCGPAELPERTAPSGSSTSSAGRSVTITTCPPPAWWPVRQECRASYAAWSRKEPSWQTVTRAVAGIPASARLRRGTAAKVSGPWVCTANEPSGPALTSTWARVSRCSASSAATAAPSATPGSTPRTTTPITVAR